MSKRNGFSPILIIGFLFFVFGFISWLNAILIPYFKLSLRLSLREAMMVTFAFYISYFVMAIPSSRILEITGFKKGMMLGLFVMAAGALFFIPAAFTQSYWLFLSGLFVQATGLTILQTASNPYVTILGPIESAARRMSLMGVCNKVAGALAPLILMRTVTSHPDEIDEIQRLLPSLGPAEADALLAQLIQRLQMPYAVIALVLILLGLVIFYSKLPDIKEEKEAADKKESLLQHPQVILGAVAIFCGVSAEVLAVDSIISYAEYHGYPFATAQYFATYTLAIMITAYVIGILVIPRYISQRKVLFTCGIAGLVLTAAVLFTKGSVSVWSVALLGFCNALIWPSIWPLALQGLGGFTKRASAYLIMGIVGGAVTPLLFGSIAAASNLQTAYAIMVPLYFFLSCYAFSGYQKRLVTLGCN
jgi:FHS family L-fucose permease-like MFS transporter